MNRQCKALSEAIFPDIVRLRRLIHRRPELAFEEHKTAQLIAETLRPLELDVRTGVARTGVVAVLRGGLPGPTIALRADMDALPITEENSFDFASAYLGKMHACGHDAHTASLLGTAMILAKLRRHVRGTVCFIFQPSEERAPGGAPEMIAEGVLDARADVPAARAIFGQHVRPDLPVGKIGIRSGRFMASSDELFFAIRSLGGHGAAPHQLNADVVLVAAQLIVSLQSVVSRNCPPDVPSVLSIGRVQADGATNVIPDEVFLEGTFRAMDDQWRTRAHELIRRIAKHTGAAFGAEVDLKIVVGYPELVNDPGATDHVRRAAIEYAGIDNVLEVDLWYAAEDFACYLQRCPGSFYVLGTGNVKKGITSALHTPRFTIDEEALRSAPGFMAFLAIKAGDGLE